MAAVIGQKGRVIGSALGLFSLALFLTAYSAKNPEVSQIGFSLVQRAERPFQLLHQTVYSKISGLWERYIALIEVRDQNDELRSRVAALEAENSRLLEYRGENERLRNLLNLSEEKELTGVVASVIGFDPSSFSRAVIINKGFEDGLSIGMAAVRGDGLVGQVTHVSPRSSRVLLLIDPLSGVEGILQDGRVRGIVEGDGSPEANWRFVSNEEEVKIGDRIITSGMEEIFPKGILIGVISKISPESDGMFRSIRVNPAVDFGKLEDLLIVTKRPR